MILMLKHAGFCESFVGVSSFGDPRNGGFPFLTSPEDHKKG